MLFGGLLWPFPGTEGTPAGGIGDRQEQPQPSQGQEHAGGGHTSGCWKPKVSCVAGYHQAPSPQNRSSAFHPPGWLRGRDVGTRRDPRGWHPM